VEKVGSVSGQRLSIHLLSSGHLAIIQDISEEAEFREIPHLGRYIKSESGRAFEVGLASGWVGSGEGMRV
jgi:hypothetical protein